MTQSKSLEMRLPKMDGLEVSPDVFLIGEPSPIPGTNKMRCLANYSGVLVLIELSIKFGHGIVGELKTGGKE